MATHLTKTPSHTQVSRSRLALIGCCVAQFILTINGSIASIVLPSISSDFGIQLPAAQWAVSIYPLTVACLLILMGNLADRCGRRTILLAGVGTLLVSSILCAVSPNILFLTVCRSIQAVGGAMIATSGLAAVSAQSSDAATKAKAIAWWAAVGGVALAAGPFFGGVLAEWFSWRGVFWFSVPLAALAYILLRSTLVESKADTPRPIDVVGQVLVSSVIAMASYALIDGSRIGWASPIIIGSAIFAVVLLVTAVLRARRRANPLIPLQIFANRSFVRGSFTSVLGFAAAAGFLYLAPQYLRNIEGLSAVEAGLFLLPMAAVSLIAAQVSGVIVSKGKARVDLVLAGTLIAAASLILFALADTSLVWVTVGFAVFGFGYGLLNDPLSVSALSAMPASEAGLASALFSTAKQFGQLIGIAAVSTLLIAASPTFHTAYDDIGPWAWLMLAACGVMVVALNLTSNRMPQPGQAQQSKQAQQPTH